MVVSGGDHDDQIMTFQGKKRCDLNRCELIDGIAVSQLSKLAVTPGKYQVGGIFHEPFGIKDEIMVRHGGWKEKLIDAIGFKIPSVKDITVLDGVGKDVNRCEIKFCYGIDGISSHGIKSDGEGF